MLETSQEASISDAIVYFNLIASYIQMIKLGPSINWVFQPLKIIFALSVLDLKALDELDASRFYNVLYVFSVFPIIAASTLAFYRFVMETRKFP
jgi:hypothetical protein